MQTGVDEQTQLESVLPALERLWRKIEGQKQATFQALQDFEINPVLGELKRLQSEQAHRFDLFQVLKIQDSELVHSNFLAWLMDPNQNHGLGADFLKGFLSRTCMEAAKLDLPTITPEQVHAIDWARTEIRREWENIDILVLNRTDGFVCAIENKIWADEGIGPDGKSQLHWYRNVIRKNFSELVQHYVFLSPTGMLPQNQSDRQYWTPERYGTVRELVQHTLYDHDGVIGADVQGFLTQYANTLGRTIVPEANEVAQLARKIYLEHRDAVELIYRHKPNYRDDMKQIVKETLAQQGNWEFKDEDASWFRFRPVTWANFQTMDSGTGWPSGSLVLNQFYCTENSTHLYVTIAPGTDARIRNLIFDAARHNPHLFNGSARAFADGWLVIHQVERILEDSDLGHWDDVHAPGPAKLKAWVKNFAENELPAMNDVIVKCLADYEAEQNGGQ